MTDENTTPPALGAGETIETTRAFVPRFSADGLVPAIVTDAATGEVLMFAHMNEEALRKTLDTSLAHFWSRSRGKLWMKGEESGNRLRVREIRTDCDQDVIWLAVDIEGEGVACHTGARSCFYRRVTIAPGAPASARLENVAPPQRSKSG